MVPCMHSQDPHLVEQTENSKISKMKRVQRMQSEFLLKKGKTRLLGRNENAESVASQMKNMIEQASVELEQKSKRLTSSNVSEMQRYHLKERLFLIMIQRFVES